MDDATIDRCIDKILRASGSALKNYSMPSSIQEMRAAMHAVLALQDKMDDATRTDAERYRWLREQNWHDGSMCVVSEPIKAVKPGYDCPSISRLDEAIDAAMAAKTKE
jgi:hypothetical protein